MPVIKDFKLTKREIVVLKLISMGCSNRQIAARLFISEQTVKKHLKNIFKKLNVNNRIAALKRSGLI
ncbi:MAG: response regulator transcription factor [Chitinophagaceae bacterium]|nr:response regulator transcription factor [Chitinophagaceae bacterium]